MCLKYEPAHVTQIPAARAVPGDIDDGSEERELTGAEQLKKKRKVSGDRVESLPATLSRLELEIRNYENCEEDESCKIPLQFWKKHQETFPILTKLACEVLSIPASSASSERSFSVGTRVRKDIVFST